MQLNIAALIAVIILAGALLAIFGALYLGAYRSYSRGEIDVEGVRILRWAIAGHITLYALLAITAFLT